MTALEVLQKYFQFSSFRPLQAEIIDSVLSGRDTLALMPTGGGKSLCFQVPTLAMASDDPERRLCLVVTPLIALMKDQVENLRTRGIQAAAVYTGMTYDQQKVALDNCLFGPYHFLYCSPERLENEEFISRLKQLPIGLIAIDEAHCISQWGYDFRPSYLRIADLRQHLSEAGKQPPVLALTATATPDVVDDIQDRLGFAEHNVLQKSFHRDNLHYIVRTTNQKAEQIVHILSRVPGSAIIYVRNRKRAVELSDWLCQQLGPGTADYYHAGLTNQERNTKQNNWKSNQTRVIVATNAFGMGIDKPDVRLVIHHDLPDTLEAYYQEAGRAGRDGETAYAVLLYEPADATKAQKRIHDNYPPKEFIEKVYHCTCDFLTIGMGSEINHTFSLHLDQLCQVMRLPILQTYSALHLLDQAGYIHFEEEHETHPRVRINIAPAELRHYTLSRPQLEMLDQLMRRYTGIFTDLQYIPAEAEQTGAHDLLVSLAQRGIITYLPRTIACSFSLAKEREADIYLPPRIYEQRQERYSHRLQSMLEYAQQSQFCREQLLLSYFGDVQAPVCEHCDICISHARELLAQ